MFAVIELWESDKDSLDYSRFAAQIQDGKDYDLNELSNLLRKDERPDLKVVIKRVVGGFRFLGQTTPLEAALMQYKARKRRWRRAAAKRGPLGPAMPAHTTRCGP